MSDRFGEQTVDEAAASLRRVAVTTLAVGSFSADITREHLNAARGWTDGPLPLSIASPYRSRVRADQSGRQRYHEAQLHEMVLGSGVDSWRVHQFLAEPVVPLPGVRLWAVEAVGFEASADTSERRSANGARRSAVIVHGTVDPTGMSLADVHQAMAAVDPSALDIQHRVSRIETPVGRDGRERFRLSLITKADSRLPRLAPPDRVSQRERHWAHAFGSLTLPRELLSTSPGQAVGDRRDFDADDENLLQALPTGTWFALSADWRLGVLQSGAAFVGLRADTTRGQLWGAGTEDDSAGDFYDFAEFYLRTVYADTALFGMAQRQMVQLLASDARDAARARRLTPGQVEALEVRWSQFLETVWSARASGGGISDNLLSAYHQQYRLPERLEQIERNIDSVGRRTRLAVETAQAGGLAVLSLLGAIGVVFTVTRLIATAVSSEDSTVIGIVIPGIASVLVVAALLWRLRGLRTALNAATKRW